MERPTIHDEAILAEAAKEVMGAMPAGTVTEDDQDAIREIESVLKVHATTFDEFRMARDLETRHGWECDRGVMEAFEVVFGAAHQALTVATKRWVRSNGIKPRLTLGDKATINTWSLNGGKQDLEGEIVRVDPDLATYTVMIPALGHAREGFGTKGLIVNFEDLHSIVTPAEDFELMPG